jgi:hypothetical protein
VKLWLLSCASLLGSCAATAVATFFWFFVNSEIEHCDVRLNFFSDWLWEKTQNHCNHILMEFVIAHLARERKIKTQHIQTEKLHLGVA